jgi:two-component system sensor histidine kinase PhoQ
MTPAASLLRRLLLATLVLLPLTLGLTAWYLERAHRGALDAAIAERLQLQVLSLLAQADIGDGVDLRFLPRESRLREPASGLYAMISGAAGEPLWVSPSAALLPGGLERLQGGMPMLRAGEYLDDEHDGLIRHAYQVVWEFEDETQLPLRILVAESAAPRAADVQAFRGSLMLWLGATVILLLAAQAAVMRWGLAPLRRLADRIRQIEAGECADLDGAWPREVHGVVENLDALLRGEQQRRERMRNTLADLAHSLKTPMAVLRSADTDAPDYATLQREQLERMEEVVNWQLQRGVGAGHRLMQRLEVGPVLERLRATLLKVYSRRELEFDVRVEDGALFRGDERDLMELLGNLLDNACKYGHKQVTASATGGCEGRPLEIRIDDDGDGVSPELRDSLLQRGVRADRQREGQGIGLSVVLEIVRAQGGELELGDSPLGGARILLTLP